MSEPNDSSSLHRRVGSGRDEFDPSFGRIPPHCHLDSSWLPIRERRDCSRCVHSEVLSEVGGCCFYHHLAVRSLSDHHPMVGRKVRTVVLAFVAHRADVAASDDGYGRHKDDPDEEDVRFHLKELSCCVLFRPSPWPEWHKGTHQHEFDSWTATQSQPCVMTRKIFTGS